ATRNAQHGLNTEIADGRDEGEARRSENAATRQRQEDGEDSACRARTSRTCSLSEVKRQTAKACLEGQVDQRRIVDAKQENHARIGRASCREREEIPADGG